MNNVLRVSRSRFRVEGLWDLIGIVENILFEAVVSGNFFHGLG